MKARKKLQQYMTVDEWRAFEEKSEIKHDYIDGYAYAFPRQSRSHASIGGNTSSALYHLLDDREHCYVYGSNITVCLSETRHVYPDVSVSCDERDRPTDNWDLYFPCVIVEVHSAMTEAHDRGERFSYYQAFPHMQEYMLIGSEYQSVEVFRRNSGNSQEWTYRAYKPGEEVYLTSLDIHFPVDLLYRKTAVPLLPNDARDVTMAVQSRREYLTVDEWRELERTSRVKHEYRDGRIYAMTRATDDHDQISGNAYFVIRSMLAAADKPGRVYFSDMAAQVSETRYVYPDVSVTCDERDRPTRNTRELHPLVVIEVLSDTTEAYDRGKKLAYYRACPSIQECVLINTEFQRVEVHRRTPTIWTYEEYGPGDEVELTSLDIRIPLDVLYFDTDVPLIDDAEGEV